MQMKQSKFGMYAGAAACFVGASAYAAEFDFGTGQAQVGLAFGSLGGPIGTFGEVGGPPSLEDSFYSASGFSAIDAHSIAWVGRTRMHNNWTGAGGAVPAQSALCGFLVPNITVTGPDASVTATVHLLHNGQNQSGAQNVEYNVRAQLRDDTGTVVASAIFSSNFTGATGSMPIDLVLHNVPVGQALHLDVRGQWSLVSGNVTTTQVTSLELASTCLTVDAGHSASSADGEVQSGEFVPNYSDLTGDGVTDGADLAALLAAWGATRSSADLNADGLVDGADLAQLLAEWG